MKERFSDAQKGDVAYDRVYGYGNIMQPKSEHTPQLITIRFISGAVRESTLEGCIFTSGLVAAEPTLFYVDGDNKYATERPVPKVPWDKVPVDTKIIIDGTRRRYYAGNKEYFSYGATSWSRDCSSSGFGAYTVELAEEITIDDITYPIGSK